MADSPVAVTVTDPFLRTSPVLRPGSSVVGHGVDGRSGRARCTALRRKGKREPP